MLSKTQMESIAAMIGLEADVFAKAISDEQETNLELPDGRFLSKEKEETLIDNVGKKKYDQGKAKGLKEAYDGKSKEDFLNEFKKTALEEANIEPKKQVEALQESLNQLQQKYKTDIASKDQIINDKEKSLGVWEKKSKLQTVAPDFIEGMNFNDAHTIFSANFEQKEDGVYRNGELLKNDLQSPISYEDAFKSFVSERGWTQEKPRGNGGKKPTFTGGVPKNYDEFEKYCESKDIRIGSQAANEKLQEFAKENQDFFNS